MMSRAGVPGPDVIDLIRAKRDGSTLDSEAISWLVGAYARDEVPDEQMAALLMAIYFRGLEAPELHALTKAIIESGERLDLAGAGRPTVDKHSTGGVGDKVSLVLAPLVACCGAAVPQLSGRGLGHTGGTLDKLESIAGFRSELSPSEMLAVLGGVGCVISAAGPGLAPADRRLYALRDVTGTVESIPLIASSIMSKKIAEGTSALVLDVKVGSGAFMVEEADARRLAETMVSLGTEAGVRTSALLTRMDEPLGNKVGNALEVAESLETLRGNGPADLVEVTLALAEEMLALVGLDSDPAVVLQSGQALLRFQEMVEAQGGDPDAPLPRAEHVELVRSESSGYLCRLDARAVGVAAWRLGAGRARKQDRVNPAAGIVCPVSRGEPVERGQVLLELHTDEREKLTRAKESLIGAIEIGPEPPARQPMVLEVIRP
jgi:thymidine phosphorylase